MGVEVGVLVGVQVEWKSMLLVRVLYHVSSRRKGRSIRIRIRVEVEVGVRRFRSIDFRAYQTRSEEVNVRVFR